MQGKKILIAITGSVAAYKIPQLVRQLQAAGAEVRVICTPAATSFVSPLVLGTLTKHTVYTQLFEQDTWSNHVMLGRWADVILVAPCSCNTLAKLATGQCDNFVLAVLLSATCPVHIATAMDEDMWHHPATKRNIATLRNDGYTIIDSTYGALASGLVGMGRMAEVNDLEAHCHNFFTKQQVLQGKHILITAGPTYENIDPVRFIGNHSTGKMGIALANAAAALGATVHLVLGPTNLLPSHPNVKVYAVTNAATMYSKAVSLFKKCQVAIMSAAVADYTPKLVAKQKIKKQDNNLTVELIKTKDILKQLGTVKAKGQLLVGFALESNNEEAYALKKLNEKNADFIVLNSLNNPGTGFGHDTNAVTIFGKKTPPMQLALQSKQQIAQHILHHIIPFIK
jgi:phosphopantothenoylcysteine decarboxylase / phosphopantothenate---cysteine ligase